MNKDKKKSEQKWRKVRWDWRTNFWRGLAWE